MAVMKLQTTEQRIGSKTRSCAHESKSHTARAIDFMHEGNTLHAVSIVRTACTACKPHDTIASRLIAITSMQ